MSNPVLTIGDTIITPADPIVQRRTFAQFVYESQDFYTYADGEYNPTYTGMAPGSMGQRFYMFVPMDDALGVAGVPPGVQPDITSDGSWELLKKSPSAIVTGVKSIMPKIIIPSKLLVDNGLITTNDVYTAAIEDGGFWKDLFNWEIVSFNGDVVSATEFYKITQTGGFTGSQYLTNKGKEDSRADNQIVLKLRNFPDNGASFAPPDASPHGLRSEYGGLDNKYVVAGAFVLMLNLAPNRPATTNPSEVADNPWVFKIEFGDVTMEISEAGAAKVTVAGENSGNVVIANLSDAKAKEGPAQQQHIDEKQPYIIFVYPVWNGIVVASGVQEGRGSYSNLTPVLASSFYVPKLKDASIWIEPYSSGFDPANPADVEIETDLGAVEVDFGSEMLVTANNVKFEISYTPCFFSKEGWFDEWFVASDDVAGVVDFEYAVYPIWTRNGSTNVNLDPVPVIEDTAYDGPVDGSSYRVVPWRLKNDKHDRVAGQIFGSFLETIETRDFPVRNDNGNFSLNWNGGIAGDPSPASWDKYIQNVSINISDEGSSGSITVDKYGVAGQLAEAIQKIGALTIDATGGYGTQAGSVFKGLALGVSSAESTDGSVWTIPLVGLERKMEDIALINVPFFDGEKLGVALDFLTRHAGIISNTGAADTNVILGFSEDISVPRFDWKSGTSVKTALDEVMADTLHNYIVRDGQIYFYEFAEITGLPVILGQDWEPTYPGTKIVSIDKTPDFDDLRNELMALALEQVPEGKGVEIENIPLVPMVELRRVNTTPSFPWARSWIQDFPGALTRAQLIDSVDRLVTIASTYIVSGRTSIPGNANIKPYDRWGSLIVKSINHNIDLVGKTWTTDLEFIGNT